MAKRSQKSQGELIKTDDLPVPVAATTPSEEQKFINRQIPYQNFAGKNEELEFQIKYQACNEKTCLPPKTLKLTGKIDIVKAGTPVKQINQKYFTDKK